MTDNDGRLECMVVTNHPIENNTKNRDERYDHDHTFLALSFNDVPIAVDNSSRATTRRVVVNGLE